MVHEITWLSLSWCLIPVLLTVFAYYYWQANIGEVVNASIRMTLQLIAVGYVLIFLFDHESIWLALLVMTVMLSAATWIAVRPVKDKRGFFKVALISLFVSVGFHLFLSLKLVMGLEQWYTPRILIPIAGMFFANTMNAVSLAAERFESEFEIKKDRLLACQTAFRSCMIPQINSLLAVGLVALPGMMTGQILSGVSPLVAVRYQILIMTMLLGCSAVAAAIMLWLVNKKKS